MKNKKLIIIPISLFVVLLSIVLFMMSPLFSVERKIDTITLEAGQTPKYSLSDFLEGDDWCVNLSYLDTSEVNHKKVGEYPVYIYHGFEKYTVTAQVVDTTAPTLSCNVKNITIEKGEYLTVNTIGMKAEDNTGIDRLLFEHIVAEKIHIDESNEDPEHLEDLFLNGRDIWTKEYTFDHGGIYTLTVMAMDAYNNQSELSIHVTVEEPPVLETIDTVYLAIGQMVDFSAYVEVWDYLDEDYSISDVVIDTSALDTDKSGEYQVIYTAKDSYGLSTQAATTVYLRTPLELQDMINTHKINKDEHLIIGAYNPYDSGYYEENNTEFIQNVMLPSIVHIENDSNCTFGSGYIIKIDESFVTIATNDHVISGDFDPEIYFYDGTYCEGIVVASDPREDIAFVRIPIDGSSERMSLPFEYVETLRTVHINEGYWESLSNEKNISICYSCIDSDGNIWQLSNGHMVYKEATRTWNEYEDINECIISMDPVGGTSGSAIFDGHGRLIAMVRGYTTYYEGNGYEYVETVAVPLCEILDYYQTIFHEKLHYQ
ncbi:MAG: trypsin-like peptidase domain-containing protein [Agathobacter sp.]